ncbi:carboxypeptidase regulatory-like domain-containing protein [Dyadobacter frigoris]|nr:carboxypeptidase-like regulatory domain-containing protein [Dyadobacter frigoris]
MKKYLYIFIFLILTFRYSQAQNLVKGVVKDGSGQTIPGATVILKGTSRYASTDVDGKFNIARPKICLSRCRSHLRVMSSRKSIFMNYPLSWLKSL